MKTTWTIKMVLALAAATAVTTFIATPSFARDRDKDGGRGKSEVRDGNRDRDQNRNWDRDNDRNRDSDRDRKGEVRRGDDGRWSWYNWPRYYYRPAVCYSTVRVITPCRPTVVVRPPVVVCRPAPVYRFGLWFGW